MTRYVVILGSLDTKGMEIAFLRERVRVEGGTPLVIDTGVLNSPSIQPDISRWQVAEAGGSSIEDLIRKSDKARALEVMADGASVILHQLLGVRQLGGVLSIGGSRGTALSTQVMQSLPIGVPKLMISTMASGHNSFGPYVGTKDVTLMYSVADVQGINAVTLPIFTNAAAAIVAMSRVGKPIQPGDRRVLTASILGATTPLVSQIQRLAGTEDNEVIAFHAVGSGGRAMEELVGSDLVEGVFDVTLGEMTALAVGGKFSAGPDRMRAAGGRGLPQVIAPGGLDFIIVQGSLDTLPERYQGRKVMAHTSTIVLVRTSAKEMTKVARLIAKRLEEATGPTTVILPLRSFSLFSQEGSPLYDPESDRAFIDTFKAYSPPRVQIIEMDAHLNDLGVGETAVRLMREMLE